MELLRAVIAMIRTIYGVRLIEQKNTKEIMQMLVVAAPIEKMVRAAAVRWYRHVLQSEKDNMLNEALSFEVIGRRKGGRPKETTGYTSYQRNWLKKNDTSRKKWRL